MELSAITQQTMSSREIAELTGKRHDHVLRDIDEIVKSLNPDLGLGFKTTTYKDASGKSNRMYVMDKDSTLCLVTGYDVNARMTIVKRWQELEATQPAKSPIDLIIESALQIKALQDEQARQADEIEVIKSRQDLIEESVHEFTILAYWNYRGIGDLPLSIATKLGMKVAKYCRDNGIIIGKQRDPRFGLVNSYPEYAILHIAKAEGFIPE